MAWTSPRTWVSGEVVTAALMNTHVRDQLLELAGTVGPSYQNYTPTVQSGFTVGTTGSSLTGRYVVIGKTVHYRALAVLGTGFTIGTNWGLSLPVTAASGITHPHVTVTLTSEGVNNYLGAATMNTTAILFTGIGASGAGTALSTTSPFTWKATDKITMSGTYEAA